MHAYYEHHRFFVSVSACKDLGRKKHKRMNNLKKKSYSIDAEEFPDGPDGTAKNLLTSLPVWLSTGQSF
jgi:hypothetical protein